MSVRPDDSEKPHFSLRRLFAQDEQPSRTAVRRDPKNIPYVKAGYPALNKAMDEQQKPAGFSYKMPDLTKPPKPIASTPQHELRVQAPTPSKHVESSNTIAVNAELRNKVFELHAQSMRASAAADAANDKCKQFNIELKSMSDKNKIIESTLSKEQERLQVEREASKRYVEALQKITTALQEQLGSALFSIDEDVESQSSAMLSALRSYFSEMQVEKQRLT